MKDDTISRAAALDALGEEPPVWYDGEDEIAERDQWRRDVAAIKALPSAQLAQDLPNGCTDTISRAAVGDALNRIEISRNASWYEFYQKALTAVGNLPSAQQWIPCSERMPFVDEYGKSDQVLATCGLQGAETSSIRWLRILYFNGCNWCFPTGESYEQMVYAWMPLPKPAKIEV